MQGLACRPRHLLQRPTTEETPVSSDQASRTTRRECRTWQASMARPLPQEMLVEAWRLGSRWRQNRTLWESNSRYDERLWRRHQHSVDAAIRVDWLTFPICFGAIVKSQCVDRAAASRTAKNDIVIHSQFGTNSALRCKLSLWNREQAVHWLLPMLSDGVCSVYNGTI